MIDLHPELARLVLAELPTGVILLDARGRVSWLNRAAERLLELPRERLLGRRIETLPETAATASEASVVVGMRHDLVCRTRTYAQGLLRGTLIVVHPRDQDASGGEAPPAPGLTVHGLLNRAALRQRLENEISRSRRYQNPLTCLSFRLREGIDTPAGIARLLKEQLRWVDLLGQWEDDVLLAILPETSGPAAGGLVRKLADALRDDLPLIGRASWRRGDDLERLVARALAAGAGRHGSRPQSGQGA